MLERKDIRTFLQGELRKAEERAAAARQHELVAERSRASRLLSRMLRVFRKGGR